MNAISSSKWGAALAGLGFFLLSPCALGADTAMITQLQGNVVQAGQPARALTKLRQGDTVALSPGAQVEIIYLDNGRQEKWANGSRFTVGSEKSEALKGEPVSVSKIPLVIAKQLGKTPDGSTSTSRVGMVRLRATNLMKLREIEDNYLRFKQEAQPGSWVAELYKLNGLLTLNELALLEDFVGDMRRNAPNDPGVAEIAARYLQAAAQTKSRLRDTLTSVDRPAN